MAINLYVAPKLKITCLFNTTIFYQAMRTDFKVLLKIYLVVYLIPHCFNPAYNCQPGTHIS